MRPLLLGKLQGEQVETAGSLPACREHKPGLARLESGDHNGAEVSRPSRGHSKPDLRQPREPSPELPSWAHPFKIRRAILSPRLVCSVPIAESTLEMSLLHPCSSFSLESSSPPVSMDWSATCPRGLCSVRSHSLFLIDDKL